MIWNVKKGLFRHTVYDPGNAQVARIRSPKGGYSIEDAAGKDLLRIWEDKPLVLAIRGTSGKGNAVIELEKTQTLACPPRADRLALRWNQAEYTIEQTQGRDFQIYGSGKPMGRITGMLGGTARVEWQGEGTPEMAALLFALADRMLREDDLLLV